MTMGSLEANLAGYRSVDRVARLLEARLGGRRRGVGLSRSGAQRGPEPRHPRVPRPRVPRQQVASGRERRARLPEPRGAAGDPRAGRGRSEPARPRRDRALGRVARRPGRGAARGGIPRDRRRGCRARVRADRRARLDVLRGSESPSALPTTRAGSPLTAGRSWSRNRPGTSPSSPTAVRSPAP